MEVKFAYTKQNPKETANPISRLFFGWMKDLYVRGTKRELTLSDLYHPLKSDSSKTVTDRLQEFWNQELQKWQQKKKETQYEKSKENDDSPRLERALIRAFWKEYFFAGILVAVVYSGLFIFNPLILSWIIGYFKIDDEAAETATENEVLSYVCYLILCLIFSVFILHHGDLWSQEMGMKIRVACCSLIYRKILRLGKGALIQMSAGQVVNLLSNDVSRFDELCCYLNFLWITPIQIIIVATIMWHKLGTASLVGIVTLLLITLPISTVFLRMTQKFREIIASWTDKRMQLMNELIGGIQVIKMYAWEKPFRKIVTNIRAVESKAIRSTTYIRASHLSFSVFVNRFILFVTLLTYTALGNETKAELTFMMFSYFQVIQITTTLFFPHALLLSGETSVSIKRLQKFLLLEEHTNEERTPNQNGVLKFKKKNMEKGSVESIKMRTINANQNLNSKNVDEQVAVSIELERVSANWIPKQLPPTLCNLSVKIEGGDLCALVGPVGSGKSSILYLLLKELRLGAGKMKLYRKPLDNYLEYNKQGYASNIPNLKISYASQEAWLFSGSVRDNILFGQPYDKERYMAVTRACALIKDFQQLPYGDMSNVGEGGSSLSGGQKARVNLARAVYRKADVYLFDDPLSAVDSRVAKHLFYRCIKNYLRGATRILVTHQLQFIRQTDTVAVLDRGSISMYGTYKELSKSNENFMEIMNRIETSTEAKKQTEVAEASESLERKLSRNGVRRLSSVISTNSSVVSYDYEECMSVPDNNEAVATGRFSNKIYQKYFQSGGSIYALIALLVMFIVSQVAMSGNDYWVSYWTNTEIIRRSLNKNNSFKPQYSFYVLNDTMLSRVFNLDKHGLLGTVDAIYLYTLCIVSCIVTVFARNIYFMKVCTNASRNLHDMMFSNILQATMTFFHNNVSGRILNRFSKDMGSVDEVMPKVILEISQVSLMIVSIICMVVTVNYWMLVPLAVFLVLFLFVRNSFLRTAQSIKRLEGIAKSPVFSHVNATLSGLTTIRSSGSNILELLQKQFDDLQDVHTGTWHMSIVVPVIFGLYMDLFVTLFIACICFSFAVMNIDSILGGNVGLAISQSLGIMGSLQHAVKRNGEMISHVASVERILEYTNLPKEASWTSDAPPPVDWPKHGQVTLNNVSMKYDKEEAPVLKNLNLTIEAGWKVGVVGRTGAGKSSLISALFRLFVEGLEGEIRIDGKDTRTLGLHELRSRISIIPQQPFLVTESLRYNLDPFRSYDDALLWDSLRQVELNDITLDQMVMSGGSNLSIGQKQLICLARAILKNNRILVLDEATANIDTHTDDLIQNTIRTRFADCTVITIAHRLHTIIDSDRIIVMDFGSIAEFGRPYELLRDKPQGIFSQMVNNTGMLMAQSLRDQAQLAYAKNTEEISLDISRTPSTGSDSTDTVMQSSL
ncbi:hypothetical protein K0M31_006239 [Melipona bicolor]|uniref:Multidrug resistance-associated protein 4 n=1 Tax=Melipona bicolor TaxID=60889 RepID=A0AA40FT54_9HYME|nr:hypothetical protein K0M31_006239 [Melipona bicolor]